MSAVVAVATVLTAAGPSSAAESARAVSPPGVPRTPSVPVSAVRSHYHPAGPVPAWHPATVRWPSGSGQAVLGSGTANSDGWRAGTLPVRVKPARTPGGSGIAAPARSTGSTGSHGTAPAATGTRVRVEVASHAAAAAAGIDGVLLALRSAASSSGGEVQVALDYSPFRDAFGGDWASRLHLVTLPACALTTPHLPACRRQTPVASTNSTAATTVRGGLTLPAPAPAAVTANSTTAGASVASAMVVLAATAGTSGGAGDYSATSLRPSGSWQAGGSADAFSWSYPISVPAVPGGLVPDISLTYSSQGVDGLTSATNNQASWIGDGWDYSPGFIERSYASCHDNPAGATRTYDTCWSAKNTLTMSFNGATTPLVKDDATGAYHPVNDVNEKVEYLTGAANGAHGGEYWRVTAADGTQYYFGRNRLPGWANGDATTNAVWTEPVFATASGQPCYNANFASSWCQQAYRWNLDYVVDPHADTIAYFYATQTNAYARDLGSTANTSYTRGGYLTRIQYGQRDGAVYSTTPAGQVTFTVAGRCSTSAGGCATSSLSSSTASNWPDVPYDLNCASGATCSAQSPSFWSEYELTGIRTQALVGSSLADVDAWSLTHSYPATGDSTTQPSAWLSSITRTGQDTGAGGSDAVIALPPVTFTATMLANRADVTNGYSAITRGRMSKITTETGEVITVGYSSAACASATPASPSTNTKLCYPGYWTPAGQTAPMLDWFNKYIVTAVTEQDPTGGSANDDVTTTYTPVGTPAWRHDDNPLVPAAQRTWDQWRGYAGMIVSTGTAPDPITKTQYVYFRGMDGDTLTSGTRSVSVKDLRGDPAVVDADQYAGFTYETRVFNGAAVVSDTVSTPWSSAATASHALTGLPAQRAFHTGVADTRTYAPLAGGGTRTTETAYTHDRYGRVTATNDLRDISVSGDDLCTRTSYADNTSKWILNTPAETTTVSAACTLTPSLPTDAVSDVRTFYDGSTTLGAAPTAGDVTMTQKAASFNGSTPTFITFGTTTVDEYGRPTATSDGDNRRTTTSYTPATGAMPTRTVVTDPLAHSTTTTLDPRRNLTLSVTDPGGFVTTTQYDALGRRTAIYTPGRTTSPRDKFSYTVSATGPSVVRTYTLNEDATYRVSETLYDSRLRARETQAQTPDGGRDITDTVYNTDGWKSQTTAPYFNSSPVAAGYVQAQAGQVPAATGYVYDAAGRQTAQIAYALGSETWRTTTRYPGAEATTTIPPAGGTASTIYVDARGRTTARHDYHAGVSPDATATPRSGYDVTTYTYTPDGKRASLTDNAGNTWRWSYNLLGYQTKAVDPDTGTTTSSYDNAGQLITSTDARGAQVTTSYDLAGRKTASYDTTSTQTLSAANKLAEWTYDTLKKGYPTASVSYSGGDTYTSTVLAYNGYAKAIASKITVTGENAALAPTAGYVIGYGYSITGRLTARNDPAAGDLPHEAVSYGADSFGEPTSLTSAGSAYVNAVGYDEYGHPLQYTMGNGANLYWNLTYDPQTQAVTGSQVTGTAAVIDHTTYGYANGAVSAGAGLLVKAVDTRDGGAVVDTQCYTYDYATRLQAAWTATDGCSATPAIGNSSTVGGPVAPYWQSWTYDAAGNRATQTDHDVTGTTGSTAGDTVTAYHYPAAGSATDQPHTLTSTTATGAEASANTASYRYDAAGNTTGMTGGPAGSQTLTWTPQGKPATDTTNAGKSSYVYDADGNLVVRRDPVTTTLFLGDTQVVLDNTTKSTSATRYYSIGGTTIAARTAGGVSYLIPDSHGTAALAVSDATQAVTRREYLPFGGSRGTAPVSWPGENGFLNAPTDTATTLVDLGAREYDSSTGRFLSADPVLSASDPTQLNGYDYAGNDPISSSDPTGLYAVFDPVNGGYTCYGGCASPAPWEKGYTGDNTPSYGGSPRYNPHTHTFSHPDVHPGAASGPGKPWAPAKPKPHHWWDTAVHWATSPQVVGAVVGVAAGSLCTALSGGTLVVACGIVGGGCRRVRHRLPAVSGR